MANQAEKKPTIILPPEAARSGQDDAFSVEKSFTAKEQHDLLEAAFKSLPLDDDSEIAPVIPLPSLPPDVAPKGNTEQIVAWWTWANANVLKKTTILKSAVALLVAVTLGWIPLQRLLATTSAEAIINARVVVVRAPIEGEVSVQTANLEVGKEFRQGDELLTVKNPTSDQASLDNLNRTKEQLRTTIAVLQEKKLVLERHRSALAVQKERYRTRFISQSPHWLILIRCFFAWPICAQFNLTRVCALGLTISPAFKLEPSFWQDLISMPLSEGDRCIRLRSRLPAHCVRFGTRTGWAYWVAFTSRPGPLPAKRHDHNTASSIWAMPCPVCHSLNARVTIVNASTCPLAVSSSVGSA